MSYFRLYRFFFQGIVAAPFFRIAEPAANLADSWETVPGHKEVRIRCRERAYRTAAPSGGNMSLKQALTCGFFAAMLRLPPG